MSGISRLSTTAATVGGWFAALRPRPRTSLAEWALAHARLYDGRRFVPYAYQRAILDAMTDPAVTRITLMKSARVGYTQMLSAAIGYFIAHRPSKMMVLQPATEDAEDYSFYFNGLYLNGQKYGAVDPG